MKILPLRSSRKDPENAIRTPYCDKVYIYIYIHRCDVISD